MARRKGRLESTSLVFAPITAPTATVLDFAGAVAPSGWLLCDGSAVSRTTYANLFVALGSGTIYGAGNGTTTFNLPDLRGRVTAGKDDMGGGAANRITGAGSGITGTTLGATGGTETHALSSAENGSHTHTQSSHTHLIANGATADPNSTPLSASNSLVEFSNAGSNNAQNAILAGAATTPDRGLTNSATPSINSSGSGTAHQNTQPTLIVNKIIKT